jgi:hypothetical protein
MTITRVAGLGLVKVSLNFSTGKYWSILTISHFLSSDDSRSNKGGSVLTLVGISAFYPSSSQGGLFSKAL